MAEVPATHRDILTGKNFAHVATLMPDGTPQVTPVWVDFDGQHVLVNTAEGRQKTRNLDRNGHVAISVADQENPYKYVQIRGHVVERTHEGAEQHIDALAKRYMGVDIYPAHDPNAPRVLYKIAIDRVQTMG